MLAVPPRNLPGVEWFERVHVLFVRHAIRLQWCSPRGTQQIAAMPSDWDEQQKQMCAVFWQHWIPTKISLERWIENKNNLANCRRDSPKEHIAIGQKGFTPFWPIVVVGLSSRSQPFQEAIDWCLHNSFIHSSNSFVSEFQQSDLGQFLVANALLHNGQNTHIAGQGMNCVQQWHQIGKEDAHVLQTVERNGGGNVKSHIRQYWLHLAQESKGLRVEMSERLLVFKAF